MEGDLCSKWNEWQTEKGDSVLIFHILFVLFNYFILHFNILYLDQILMKMEEKRIET